MKQRISIAFLTACLTLSVLTACNRSSPSTAPAHPSGTIETDEVHVASRYGGRVERVLAQEGAALTPGQIIVELAAPELAARRDQAAAALADLEAGPRKEEIAAAQSEWEAVIAELELAKLEEKRARDLAAAKVNTQAELDRAATRTRALEKSVAAAKSRHELVMARARPDRVTQLQAQIAELDTHLRELKICAPTNCVLEVLNVKPGDVLPPNREIGTLLLTQHLWLRVYVPLAWLERVKVGQPVKVRLDSGGGEFPGVVEQVSRAAEFTPRNVQTRDERLRQVFGVKVRLDNGGDKLRAGMSAEVVFPEMAK